MASYFCLFLKKLHWENNGKSAYHKCPFHVDHFSKFLRDLLESACDCFYIKGWDQLVCTEVCISYNMDVSFLVALAFSAYFSRWLQHLARSHMMMSQGSEGTELSNEARIMFLMSLCVGICEEGVALAQRDPAFLAGKPLMLCFPSKSLLGTLPSVQKAWMKSMFCKCVIHQNDWWGISGNPGFFYFPPVTSEVKNFWSTWSEVSCHNKVINVVLNRVPAFHSLSFLNTLNLSVFGVSYGTKYLLSVILWPCYLMSCTCLVHNCLQDFLYHSVVGDCGPGLTNVGTKVG